MSSLGSNLEMLLSIYAPDANLIVSLLDLHPQESEYAPESVPGIEILEAGTGHGALTLHLARAIHAANAGRHVSGVYSGHPGNKAGISRGRALIHTIDVSPKYSEHAAKIVRGFRQGLYMRDIEFHIGDVSEWIDRQKSIRDMRNLLSHALLDLPSSHSYVEKVASALRVDGKLVVFNPSITQINSAIQLVKTKRLPLQLERVVEVGHAMTGGRIWDVRFVKPRILTKRLNVKQTAAAVGDSERAVGTGEDLDARAVDDDDSVMDEEGYEMVCRPKVGGRTSGGGFVALWSKNRTREDGQRPEAC
ncbi:MAG: hypothetical protein LQ338_002418 [Usnochroma carphineum]|nr:MAG: hypothetical protein LQ338_002418 [Usnochroma carphineum]